MTYSSPSRTADVEMLRASDDGSAGRCYEVAEASAVQPFAYFQLVFGAGIGLLIFGETLAPNVAIGTAIVVVAGIFTILRTARK